MSVSVVVDDREPAGLVAGFRAHADVASVSVRHLDAGDVLLAPVGTDPLGPGEGGATDEAAAVVGIERKTPGDYCQSLVGRGGVDVEDQVERLRAAVDHAYLLVEGTLEAVEACRPGLADASVRGSLASVTARLGAPVVPCGDRERLIDLAVRLARKHTESPGARPIPAGTVTRSDVPVAVRMYAAIDGIGPETATRLHAAFPSVASLLAASPADLEGVDGVGTVRARAIFEALRTDE